MTSQGLERLKEELRRLTHQDRPEITRAIADAREHGDLSENAEYHAARERQSFIEGRISEIEGLISRADVIDVSRLSGDTAKFGATVRLADLETDEERVYHLVGPVETEAASGRISVSSPIGKALIGRKVGDQVEVISPGGRRTFEIMDISFM